MTLGQLKRMLAGARSQEQGPGTPSPLQEPRPAAPVKDLQSWSRQLPSPSPGLNPGQGTTRVSLPATLEPPNTGSRAAAGPLACLGHRQEARLPFSKFLDEVTMRVLDPETLEAFRGPRAHSPGLSSEEHGPGQAAKPLVGTASPEEKAPVGRPQLFPEMATGAADTGGRGQADTGMGSRQRRGCAGSPRRSPGQASAADMEKLRLHSPWVPSCLGQPRVLQGRLARSSPSLWDSALQEQKGELRKRLSYTTHKLEKLETEFDSTRHYLEIELRRAQEELEKVTEKLRRIQTNYMALQRINQELEEKLYRMGQHYEEEKRALSHEIVALNSHLLEAKVTIDKLSEDNELYRKDCNLAAQLLQCSQTYGRVHKVSELPSDFQERMSLHLEKHGRSLPSPLCRPAYADSVPTCVIAKVLEKPDPASLSSHLSDASARDLAFRDSVDASGPGSPYKEDLCCGDSALYHPEEPELDQRPGMDAPVADVGFLQAQNSTDSTAEEEEEAEAAAFPASFRHDAFPGYAGSLPTSSSYSSFSATSEEKEHAQASTLTASQQAIYLSSRDELFSRKLPTYESSPHFAKAAAAVASPLEAEVAQGFSRTMSPYPAESYRFPASPGPQQALMPPNLWSLRAKPGSARLSRDDMRGHWRPLSVEDIGAYSYPAATMGRGPPRSFSERYYGGSMGSPGRKPEGRASPLYASYKADSFSEGDDLSQGHLGEPCFLRAGGGGGLSLSPSRSADPVPDYAPSDGDGDRLGVQLCGAGSSPEPEHGSRESLEPSSMEASPEMRPAARPGPQQAFPRSGSSGLSRKDSLTKAQLYGTLLN